MTGDPGSEEASQNARTRRVLLSRLRAELREIAVIFEAPGTALEARDRPNRVSLRSGRSVFVLSPEDALLWRLREWVHWRSSSAFRQAAYLLGSSQLDRGRLDARAREEGLASALTMLAETVARLAAGEQLEDREIADIGRQGERESYRKSDDIDS